MLQPVLVGGEFEIRKSVKGRYGQWICEGMYVNEVNTFRQGYVTEVIDNNNGFGEIKVKVVRVKNQFLDEKSSYITGFEPSTNWCKALTEG